MKRRGEIAIAIAIIGVLALTVVPVPALLVDALLALSLCAAMVTFLVAFYVEKPLDFSSFPALLLFVTLFRLSLNVASTRLILTDGGGGEGSKIIAAFGEFAVGGNFVVGAVVFLILVIVNFIVITKGAERVSEVSARFTLDSLPGKQMAVDADLGAGLINEDQARKRRADIAHEADFHGAMDGASKFVRGDAIAGLLITAINIIGGMIIGLAQLSMSAGEAATTFTVLSIGDGLVSQIPALLVSTAAALLITRTGDAPVSSSLGKQLIGRRRPLSIAAMVIAFVGLLPGMPHLVFLGLAGVLAYIAVRKTQPEAGDKKAGTHAALPAAPSDLDAAPSTDPVAQRAELESMIPVDLLSLEVGLELLPMVDADRGGELLVRIASMRKQIASDLGLLIPPVHVRDDLRLPPGGYKIVISGVEVASGEIHGRNLLAIDPTGRATAGIPGKSVMEPTFGLPAKWIAPSERARAEAVGCTVVDPSAVVATHITELVRRHAADLLGRREAQELLDIAARKDEKVVEELIPHLLSIGEVIGVLRNLLAENISVRDMRTILETLADHAGKTKDPDELTELVRERLARRITRANTTDDGTLRPMVLSPATEDLFRAGSSGDARSLSRLTGELERRARAAVSRDEPALLVVAPDIRRAVAGVAARHVPGLAVMSYREVDPNIAFQTSCVITAEESAR